MLPAGKRLGSPTIGPNSDPTTTVPLTYWRYLTELTFFEHRRSEINHKDENKKRSINCVRCGNWIITM